MIDIIKKLTTGEGVSGNEHRFEPAFELLSKFTEAKRMPNGSITGSIGNGKTKILLDAHLDRIGLIVTAIDDSGFLRVDRCGGCDVRALCAAEVTVWGKKPVYGVVTSTPPHLAKSDDANKAPGFDEIFVDIGMTKEEAVKIISVGDRITIDAPVTTLNDNVITGAALDDRIGIAAILRVFELLKDKDFDMTVTALFSVQEETTEAGGKTGAFSEGPDEAIAIDVSFAAAPGIAPTECGKLNEGGMICISPSLSADMSEELMEIAEKNGIKYQTEVCPSSTGTNADVISVSKAGVRTGLVSIPLRNMHTQAEIADLRDIESVAQIIAAYIMSRGGKNNA